MTKSAGFFEGGEGGGAVVGGVDGVAQAAHGGGDAFSHGVVVVDDEDSGHARHFRTRAGPG
jgi:hypothetical protein